MSDVYQSSVELHDRLNGKIDITNKMKVDSKEDLSLLYSPGVAQPCLEIEKDPSRAYDLTIKSNTIAVVTNGTAVLGLGDIGALASLPVMEGKAMLFKKFADVNAFPICIDSKDTDEIVDTVRKISPVLVGSTWKISKPRRVLR